MKSVKILMMSLVMVTVPTFAQHNDKEHADPKPAPIEAWQNVKNVSLGWGSIDVRYKIGAVPQLDKSLSLYAWKGERVNAQAVVMTPQTIGKLSVKVSDLKNGKHTIASDNIEASFVRYVMSEGFYNKADSCLMPDRLEPATEPMAIDANTVRPLWLTISIPQDAASGKYKGTLTAVCDNKELTIPYVVEVGKRTLPHPEEWSFHLDLWQNPYSVARHYNVPLWSQEHFNLMRPIMTRLAMAGQKVITTSIIKHPWNAQTEHPFESMIGKKKCIDGSWEYNYKVFDMWVEFMMSCGITKQIDCYTILPWHLKFEYFDEAENCTYQKHLQPGSQEYEEFLLPFLKDFAKHLRQRGWFDITCIAMDERPKDQLEPAYKVLYKADKAWRVKGAVNYFGPEVAERMHDISFIYDHRLLNEEELNSHQGRGNLVTFYTCCGPHRPNTFTFSPPAESAFLGWHAAAAKYDGYLRWAYNSWVNNQLVDSRFRSFPAGDCFMVYPGGSSIRMERLVEGIQDYEKLQILRRELKGKKLDKLNAVVEEFAILPVGPEVDIEAMMKRGKAALRAAE